MKDTWLIGVRVPSASFPLPHPLRSDNETAKNNQLFLFPANLSIFTLRKIEIWWQ